jgi:hypothetical protein
MRGAARQPDGWRWARSARWRWRVALEKLARDHAADPHAHRRRRFAIALCASDAVITNAISVERSRRLFNVARTHQPR